jgi:hypothetical protein
MAAMATKEPEMTHPSHPTDVPTDRGPGYEVRDTKVSAVAAFIVGLFVLVFLVQVFLWILMRAISGGVPEPPSTLSPPDVIHDQRRALEQSEAAALKGIDRAIEAIADKGLPVYTGKPRTEADMNSHSGSAAPAEKNESGGGAKP